MNTNQETEPQKNVRTGESDPNENTSMDTQNTQSVLTDKEDTVEYRDDDERLVLNSTQQGFGIDDGPNQPLSKEMLTDLQDAGQRDLNQQRQEEKEAKEKKNS
jgi:hypothetical protein